MSAAVFEGSLADPSQLLFTLSRGTDCTIVVAEAKNRAGGSFPDMSTAMRFIEAQCRSAGCAVEKRFDASLALIRAAGF